MEPNLKQKAAAFFVIGLMGATMGVTTAYYQSLYIPSEIGRVGTPGTPQYLPKLSLDPSVIEAKTAVVYDPQTGDILFDKDAQTQRPLASLTKLATARAVLSSANQNQMVVIKPADLAPEGDSGLRVGDVWKLSDLIAFGLTTSSNDAMAAAADALSGSNTVARMNNAAQSGDMPQSYFLNPTGLDVSSTTAGAYGSALDVAHLVDDLLRHYPSVFEATTHEPKPSGNSGKGAEATTEPIWDMQGLIAAKTGYTDLAGGNLAVAVDVGLGKPVIAVVLGSSRDGRFRDVKTLVEQLRQSIHP